MVNVEETTRGGRFSGNRNKCCKCGGRRRCVRSRVDNLSTLGVIHTSKRYLGLDISTTECEICTGDKH